MKRQELLARTGWPDPYPGFTPLAEAENLSWHFDETFLSQVVYQRCPQPELVLEVGSWLGKSAVRAVQYYTDQLDWHDFTLICVDTWLGSIEHWLRPPEHETRQALSLQHGYPQLYTHFLSNICKTATQDYIQPLPQTSMNAARIVSYYGLRFDWIFIDASHDTLDVFLDLDMYWPLVKTGGVLCGDDWNWPGVQRAVNDFAQEKNLRVYHSEHSWAFFKI